MRPRLLRELSGRTLGAVREAGGEVEVELGKAAQVLKEVKAALISPRGFGTQHALLTLLTCCYPLQAEERAHVGLALVLLLRQRLTPLRRPRQQQQLQLAVWRRW
jgi:hypothetical protein